jgi:hypothetical protein
MQKPNERGIFTLQDLANYGLHNFKDEVQQLLYFMTIYSQNPEVYRTIKNPYLD